MKSIVDKEWLNSNLHLENLVILDCRFSLSDPEAGQKAYQYSHLPGAVYFHLERDLSGPILEHGGRHPLPDLSKFALFLASEGVSNKSIVIAYDNGEGAFAARAWWLMKFIGHDEVYVLDGGFKEWEKSGLPTDAQISNREKATYTLQLRPELLATYDEVKEIVEKKSSQVILIDSREPKRYSGIEEPIDKVAGRIPGAVNKFWLEGFENGQFKPLEAQKKRFADINPNNSVIVYCGSGVTATPNYLLLHELGYQNLKLYIGSYSDWISYNNKVDID